MIFDRFKQDKLTFDRVMNEYKEDKREDPPNRISTVSHPQELILLIRRAYENKWKLSSKNIIRMLDVGIWIHTGNLFMPRTGVYIQDMPKLVNCEGRLDLEMEEQDLKEKIEKGDKSVRFVPYEYDTKVFSRRGVIRNPYIIGLFGEEGAIDLANIVKGERAYLSLNCPWNIWDKPFKGVCSISTFKSPKYGNKNFEISAIGDIGEEKGYFRERC